MVPQQSESNGQQDQLPVCALKIKGRCEKTCQSDAINIDQPPPPYPFTGERVFYGYWDKMLARDLVVCVKTHQYLYRALVYFRVVINLNVSPVPIP